MTTTCRSFVLAEANRLNHAFTYIDLQEGAERLDLFFKYGTLRNNISKFQDDGTILKFPRECPARFILKEWRIRPEYKRWFSNDKTPMGGRVKVMGGHYPNLVGDFTSFINSLSWEELVHVHDVRVEFDATEFNFLSSENGWSWQKASRSWSRQFEDFEFPLAVQAYDNWHAQVIVKCSMYPVPFSFGGLTRLTSVLGELKGQLGWSNVPNVADWTVTSWHYGRDSRDEVSGPAFNVTFRTWSKTLARIYVKREIKRVRVEEVQSPQSTIHDLFEEVLNRDGLI